VIPSFVNGGSKTSCYWKKKPDSAFRIGLRMRVVWAGGTMAQTLNVLHVLENLNVGGGQYYVLRHLARFDRSRIASFVCGVMPMRKDDNVEQLFNSAGATILQLEHRRPADVISRLRRLVQFIRANRIDLIHTNGNRMERIYGHAAAGLTGLPEIETLHWA